MIVLRDWGQVYAHFKRFHVPHDQATSAHKAFDMQRAAKRAAMDEEQYATAIFAPSQSGKTTIIKMYIWNKIVDECVAMGLFKRPRDFEARARVARAQKIVIYVNMRKPATPRSLITDILRELGDPRPESGKNVDELRDRADKLIRKHGTQLIILDNTHHLRFPNQKGPTGSEANDTQQNLKTFLELSVPLVFLGTEDARDKLFASEEIKLRTEELMFLPMDYAKDQDWSAFQEFSGELAIMLRSEGVLDYELPLAHPVWVNAMIEAADGRLGLVSVIARNSFRTALQRDAADLSIDHFAIAATQCAKHGVANRRSNPFIETESCAKADALLRGAQLAA